MFHPLPIFLGLRYVRTRGRGFFVSFISWVSMLGVCLGVAALITIISVMNGFEGELRGRLVALTAHALQTERQRTERAGCDGFLAKPCAPPDLLAEISRLLGRTTGSGSLPR